MNVMDKSVSAGSNLTVADRIAAAFARHGVSVVFGQSIPSAFHLAAPHYGIKQAGYRTENAGGVMADGYARITNRVAVLADKKVVAVDSVQELERSTHPWIQEYFLGPRGRAAADAVKKAETAA